MKPSVEKMMDEALLDGCRRRPWEQRLNAMGCTLPPALGVLAAYGIYLLMGGPAWPVGLAVFVFVIILSNLAIGNVVEFRSRGHQTELRRRYEPPDLSVYVQKAEEAFIADDPPDWVLLLEGHSLPHGGTRIVRLVLWDRVSHCGHLEIDWMSFIDFSRDRPFVAETGEEELGAAECNRFLELLPDLAAAPQRNISSTVTDGFPCRLTLLRREPRLSATHECNLAGVPEADSDHPAVQVMERMLDVSGLVRMQPRVNGWVNFGE